MKLLKFFAGSALLPVRTFASATAAQNAVPSLNLAKRAILNQKQQEKLASRIEQFKEENKVLRKQRKLEKKEAKAQAEKQLVMKMPRYERMRLKMAQQESELRRLGTVDGKVPEEKKPRPKIDPLKPRPSFVVSRIEKVTEKLEKSSTKQPLKKEADEEEEKVEVKEGDVKEFPMRRRIKTDTLIPPDPQNLYQTFDENNIECPEDANFIRVAVMGPPNAGKSTLLNSILRQKVTISSGKAHTTRKQISCIWTFRNTQVVFVDTPGLVQKNLEKKVSKSLKESYTNVLDEGIDHVVWVIDGANSNPNQPLCGFSQTTLDSLALTKIPITLVINKIDLNQCRDKKGNVSTERVTQLTVSIMSTFPSIKKIICLSALKRDNLWEFNNHILSLAMPGKWRYPKELVTTQSLLDRVHEIMREKLFRRISLDIPYLCKTEITSWKIHEIPENETDDLKSKKADADNKKSAKIIKVLEIQIVIISSDPKHHWAFYEKKANALKNIQYFGEMDILKLLRGAVDRVDMFLSLKSEKHLLGL